VLLPLQSRRVAESGRLKWLRNIADIGGGALRAIGGDRSGGGGQGPAGLSGCSHFVARSAWAFNLARKVYALIGALPFIPPGTGVDVYGTVTGSSPCGGTTIQVTSWRQNKLRCTR